MAGRKNPQEGTVTTAWVGIATQHTQHMSYASLPINGTFRNEIKRKKKKEGRKEGNSNVNPEEGRNIPFGKASFEGLPWPVCLCLVLLVSDTADCNSKAVRKKLVGGKHRTATWLTQ